MLPEGAHSPGSRLVRALYDFGVNTFHLISATSVLYGEVHCLFYAATLEYWNYFPPFSLLSIGINTWFVQLFFMRHDFCHLILLTTILCILPGSLQCVGPRNEYITLKTNATPGLHTHLYMSTAKECICFSVALGIITDMVVKLPPLQVFFYLEHLQINDPHTIV